MISKNYLISLYYSAYAHGRSYRKPLHYQTGVTIMGKNSDSTGLPWPEAARGEPAVTQSRVDRFCLRKASDALHLKRENA